jgi:hypothetical protein
MTAEHLSQHCTVAQYKVSTVYSIHTGTLFQGGGSFFRVIISFGLVPPEVAPYMTGTFGEVFGPRNQSHTQPVNESVES